MLTANDGYMLNAGGSLAAYGEKGHLKLGGSAEVSGSWAILWLSAGARFNSDQVSPYAEAGAYLLANVGFGASRVPDKGYAPHFFLGIPMTNFSREHPMFFQPYMRLSWGKSQAREYGIMVKYAFAGGRMLGSCPHVYSDGDAGEQLDGDMLSGAFSREAETDDWDRLEYLSPKEGAYRVRITNDRQERDYLNKVALAAVDHAPDHRVLPSSRGGLVELAGDLPPTRAVDGQGHDELPAILSEDAKAWIGHPLSHDPDQETKPEDTLELTFPRPTSPGMPYLVVRLRNTEDSTEAMYDYLGRMGPGAARLMRRGSDDKDIRRRIGEEIDRLGLPLAVSIRTDKGYRPVDRLRPVGPATARSQAVPLPLVHPIKGNAIQVKLTVSPGVWAIDRVAIANGTSTLATNVPLRSATRNNGAAVHAAIAKVDDQRVSLQTGDSVTLSFAAPPVPDGKTRSLFLHLHGYYEVELGNGYWLNPLAIYRHRMGTDSAPRFFLRSLRGE